MPNVLLSILGQLVERLATRNVAALPARQFFVDGLSVEQNALLHGQIIVAHAIALVSHAHFDGFELGKHIEFRQGNVGQAVHINGVLANHGIEPTATALATRGHAIFVANRAQRFADLGFFAHATVFGEQLLGGERTAANARGVSLHDANNFIDGHGAHARANCRAARAARRGRHVRIRAVVDVKHGCLRALEQDVLAFAQRVVQKLRCLGHVRLQDARVRQHLVANLINRVGMQVVNLVQNGIFLSKRGFNLHAEHFFVHQVLHANAFARRLVLVAWANATLCGANGVLAQHLFIGAVKILVIRHDDVSVAADLQTLGANAFCLQHGHFLDQRARVNNNAVANNRNAVFVHNA